MAALDDHDGNVYDDFMADLFEIVPPGEGDEFMAVKPWLGAIKEPENHPKPNKKAPKVDLDIDWVYGYRSEESRQNCHFNSKGHSLSDLTITVVEKLKRSEDAYRKEREKMYQ